MSMNCEARERDIFEFLYSPADGLLRRFTAPDYLTEDRQRTEINDMVRDMNSDIPSRVDEPTLRLVLQKVGTYVRKKHKGRAWPTISTLCDGVKFAIRNDGAERGEVGDETIVEILKDWFDKFKGPMPSIARADRTDLMIEHGIFTARQAKFYGFPLSDRARGAWRDEPPTPEEWKHHVGMMAQLQDITYQEAEARLLAEKGQSHAAPDLAKATSPQANTNEAREGYGG